MATAAQAATPRPLVYVLVLDGTDGDRYDQGKLPFLKSLNGSYFQESRSTIVAETNPNHVSMATGAYIDKSGIAGNAFAVYQPLKANSCDATGAADDTKPPTETSGEGASCLLAETVFQAVKRQGNPDGLVTAGIFGKPKLGSIFAGRQIDGKNPDADHLWAPCSSSLQGDEDYCKSVQTNPATGYAVDDKTVMDEIVRVTRQGVKAGGATKRPDFVFANLPQVDSAGHASSPGGAYDTAIGQADDEVKRLVDTLKSTGDWGRTVLFVVSDHSMDTTATKFSLSSAFTGAGIPASAFSNLGNGSVANAYLNNRAAGDRFELLKRMRAAALASPNVGEALYREANPADGGAANTIDAMHPGWHASGPRTGDLLVTAKPGAAFTDTGRTSNPLNDIGPALIGQHGGPQTRDNLFVVAGGGRFVRSQTVTGTAAPLFDDTLQNPGQAENVDIAASVMGLFGLQAPRDSAGRFLDNAFDLAGLPGAGKPATPVLRVKRSGSRRAKRATYKLTLAPAGPFFLDVKRGKKTTKLLDGAGKTSFTFRARKDRRYTFSLRTRSASGAFGEPAERTIGPRRKKRNTR